MTLSAYYVLHCKLNLAFSAVCKVTTSKFTAKLLLFSHSENYIKLTFVIVSHKIFWSDCFAPPCLLRRGQLLPSAPLPSHYMSSELQLDVCCLSCCGGDIW